MTPTPGTMIGTVLAVVGVTGAYGALTGHLPAMIGALFYPSLLTTSGDAAMATALETRPVQAKKANLVSMPEAPRSRTASV